MYFPRPELKLNSLIIAHMGEVNLCMTDLFSLSHSFQLKKVLSKKEGQYRNGVEIGHCFLGENENTN